MSKDYKDSFEFVNAAKDTYVLVRSNDDSVYSGYGVNQAFVVLEDSVLIFDSGFTLPQARSLNNSIRHITDKKIRYLINSHDHSDHVFGNSYFYKKYSMQGLRIIAHSNCARSIRSEGDRRLRSYRQDKRLRHPLTALNIKIPDLTYKLDLHLDIEGTSFSFIHPVNGAHTLGDTLLAMPQKGVLFMGDVLFNSYFPNLQDANLESWIEFLIDIDFQNYKKFVPGHGELCEQGQVKNFTRYLQEIRDHLLSSNPMDERSIHTCLELEGTRDWKFRSAIDMSAQALLSSVSHSRKNFK